MRLQPPSYVKGKIRAGADGIPMLINFFIPALKYKNAC